MHRVVHPLRDAVVDDVGEVGVAVIREVRADALEPATARVDVRVEHVAERRAEHHVGGSDDPVADSECAVPAGVALLALRTRERRLADAAQLRRAVGQRARSRGLVHGADHVVSRGEPRDVADEEVHRVVRVARLVRPEVMVGVDQRQLRVDHRIVDRGNRAGYQ